MKRCAGAMFAIVLTVGVLLISQSTLGDATPSAESASHPIVGTWRGGEYGYLYTFAAGGTAIARGGEGTTYLGAWEPDGEGGAMFLVELQRASGSGEGIAGWARPGDDLNELLIGEDTLERVVPPTLEQFLEGKATPGP